MRKNIFRIYRNQNGKVECRPTSWKVKVPWCLILLMQIKSEIDPTLGFRRSCREGISGSCAIY